MPRSPSPEPAQRVKQLAREHGFDLVRIASAAPLREEGERFRAWAGAGRRAAMRWITADWAERCSEPSRALPGARSVICLGLSYWAGTPPAAPGRGRIARYAWGRDYHAVLGEKLHGLGAAVHELMGGEFKWFVDSGPLMDKALAARAGLGWYGKNTNLLTESHGSFVFLAEILTTLELKADEPLSQTCGSCSLCVAACPTGALGPDYNIDARKCISYLTIEHRGAVPRELRPDIRDWVFGCDICQDVCPPAVAPNLRSREERRAWAGSLRQQLRGGTWSGSGVAPRQNGLHPDGVRHSVDLLWLLGLTHEQYLEAFRGTAIRRAKVWMLRRNAAVALGNVGDEGALEHLVTALRRDEHPVVRGHAAWAIGRVGQRLRLGSAAAPLRQALEVEADEAVREEIEHALSELSAERG